MKKRIAVVGAGLIGRQHAQAVLTSNSASLAAIVDPDPSAGLLASELGAQHLTSLRKLLDARLADGIMISTPNEYHVDQALLCIEAGIPVLVEKPLAVDLEGAMAIVSASESAAIPVLTGHHRRHNPLISAAKKMVDDGKLGKITAVQAATWFYKPDDYFNTTWRTRHGAGPVYLNLIHDVDMLRHLCGEVTQVTAMESNAVRGHEVEDTAVILLRFANGALGTLSVSDCTVSPWSWEMTARENPVFPVSGEQCCQLGGTNGSLSVPDLSLWQHPQLRSWMEPIGAMRFAYAAAAPLVRQIEQFARVIDGVEQPLVSARDGMINQQIIEAIKTSAREHCMVDVSKSPRASAGESAGVT